MEHFASCIVAEAPGPPPAAPPVIACAHAQDKIEDAQNSPVDPASNTSNVTPPGELRPQTTSNSLQNAVGTSVIDEDDGEDEDEDDFDYDDEEAWGAEGNLYAEGDLYRGNFAS
eukprot:6140053-Prymnesium_polylepis.1